MRLAWGSMIFGLTLSCSAPDHHLLCTLRTRCSTPLDASPTEARARTGHLAKLIRPAIPSPTSPCSRVTGRVISLKKGGRCFHSKGKKIGRRIAVLMFENQSLELRGAWTEGSQRLLFGATDSLMGGRNPHDGSGGGRDPHLLDALQLVLFDTH